MGRWVRRLAAAAATLLLLLAVYGTFVEPRLILDRRAYEVAIPGLDPQWSGATVAVFADLQLGMWLANTGMIERVVDEVVAADPTMVLLAGDFVYHRNPPVELVTELLAPLTATGIPTFAVLGNHDYASGAADEVTAALEQQGIAVLQNEAVAVNCGDAAADHQPLHVVGVGSARFGNSDPAAALADVPDAAPRIVLMHNPRSFPPFPAGSAPLAVAGHTHCGQIAIPGTPAWSYLQLRVDERIVVDGFAPLAYGAPDNRLFVTCGIGFSLVPMRINAAPQLVLFELVAP